MMHRLPVALTLAVLTAAVMAVTVFEFEEGNCLGLYVTVWGNGEPLPETYVLSSSVTSLVLCRTNSYSE
jgi:hypothetical protein